MRPFNLLALLLFLAGATWALTRSPETVRSMQATYYRAISPFLTVGSDLEVKSRAFLDEVEHSRKLEAEVDAMREDFDRLKLIESRFRTIEAENATLRRALDFKERNRFDVIAARVTRRQPTTWWQTIEIGRGTDAGIGTALPVVTDAGLVGKIEILEKEHSTIILLTDEACQVAAKVEGSPEEGIVQGEREQFGSTPLLRLRFLSPKARLQEGMRVFSNGKGGVFPADILIGEIVRIEPGPLSTEALVRPSVDFQNLSTVFVLTTPK
ncbi:rod shape-determining protein MreC [Haloferula sargassicola]|uniref:Cell shape-determining protein MreC n=1 Tax=Haloferula sargassicola TaxID=490096 RepID=A0ABP9UMD6_9BACT